MLQVVPVKNEVNEKKPKTRQTNRLDDDSNSDKSSYNIKPNTKPETYTQQPSKDFVCNSATCNYMTANPTNMHNHCIAVHKTVRFVCDWNECHKVYNSINGYTYHIKRHGIEKPLKCSYCTIYFNHEALLQEHEKIHTAAEKPYICQMCHIRFTRSSDLDRHKATCFKNPNFGAMVQEVWTIIHWVGQIHESFKDHAFFERQPLVQQLSWLICTWRRSSVPYQKSPMPNL